MSKFDAIIVGGGHNGLIAGATLAKAGQKTLILEQRSSVGGMASTGEIHPGFSAPSVSHLLFNLSPTVVKELNLVRHGLEYSAQNLSTFSLDPEGHHVQIDDGVASFLDSSVHPDAEKFAQIHKKLTRFASTLAPALEKTPPRLAGNSIKETLGFAGLGFDLMRLGQANMRELLRIVLTNIDDFVSDDLTDGPLTGALAFDAVMGGFCAPRSPGTVLTALYRLANGGVRNQPLGGMGNVTKAMANAAKAVGCEVRCESQVNEIIAENHKIVGVRLAEGKMIQASLVLSNLDVKSTLDLVGVEHFDVEAARRIKNVRTKGTAAKFNLALRDRPIFNGLNDAQHGGRILIAPSMNYIEQAFNHAKYGELSEHPIMEITLPSLSDKTLVQGDGHVLSAMVQYVPYHLKGGWKKAHRVKIEKIIMETLEQYAPGISKLVVASQLLTPVDLEEEYGTSGGHWHHGELVADQMAMLRPVNLMGRYNMHVPGLYLCGASAHPGGDVMGLSGRNCAKQALKEIGEPT